MKDKVVLGADDSLNAGVGVEEEWQRKAKKRWQQDAPFRHEEENNLLSFEFFSLHLLSHVFLSFFKALLSVLTNKFKYHWILMKDISPPCLSFMRKFCDPKGQWNTINIHWGVTKLYNCSQCCFTWNSAHYLLLCVHFVSVSSHSPKVMPIGMRGTVCPSVLGLQDCSFLVFHLVQT